MKTKLILGMAAMLLAGCVAGPPVLPTGSSQASPLIEVSMHRGGRRGAFGNYLTQPEQKAAFTKSVNQVLARKVRLGPDERLVVTVRELGYMSEFVLGSSYTRVLIEATLHTDDGKYTQVFRDHRTLETTSVDAIRRGIGASVTQQLIQIGYFVNEHTHD